MHATKASSKLYRPISKPYKYLGNSFFLIKVGLKTVLIAGYGEF